MVLASKLQALGARLTFLASPSNPRNSVPSYSIGTCRQRRRSRGAYERWMQNILNINQSVADVLCIVSTKLSIFCIIMSNPHNDMTVLYLATYRTYLPTADRPSRRGRCGIVWRQARGERPTIVRCLGPTPSLNWA